MIRKIIHIDQDTCNGCGACAAACHEGAIGIIDGKAVLLRDDYCDGLGDCLPSCPMQAISFVEREAKPYDEQAVLANQRQKQSSSCPGKQAYQLNRLSPLTAQPASPSHSQLQSWPCQLKLAPISAPYFNHAKLLIAADCSAYAYANMHQDFMQGKITLIGCPKLDNIDYSEKLTQIIATNDIASVAIVRMEVPCCGALEQAVKKALLASGKFIPWTVSTISTDGRILE